jgi:hypothetical protein
MPRLRMSSCWAIVLLTAAGCNQNAQQQPSTANPQAAPPQNVAADAQARLKAITGGNTKSPACALFTQQEIQLMLGAPVSPGETTGPLGTMCTWTGSADENARFDIQLIDDVRYWAKRSGDPEYQKLDGIAKEAFVVKDFDGGYAAYALTDKQIVSIGMRGGSSSRDAAVAGLRTVLDRLAKNNK